MRTLKIACPALFLVLGLCLAGRAETDPLVNERLNALEKKQTDLEQALQERDARIQQLTSEQPATSTQTSKNFGSFKQGSGFQVGHTDYGDLNIKLFGYVRYLNQKGLDPTYTDSFGKTSPVKQRQDMQVNKVIIYFLGWIVDPKLRYLFYTWSTNTSQGLGAQVVVAGKLNYTFNDHLTTGLGIDSLPGVRSTEGNFPNWLAVDTRLIGDEFFRPSYTTGLWARGQVVGSLDYAIMLGNNLSQLGVDAGQLDNGFNTWSGALTWMPSTGEFGTHGEYGDFANHQKLATRFGLHFTRSDENFQGQPNTDAFENVQIRLSDGNSIFTPGLFGSGIQVTDADYQMGSFDGGFKFHGFSFEGEGYWRWINNFRGPGTGGLRTLNDTGFQLQASTMLVPKTVQLYVGDSKVFGEYGNPWDMRGGINWYPWKTEIVRWNFEYLYLYRSPVGGTSLPYAVGATGSVFHSNIMVTF